MQTLQDIIAADWINTAKPLSLAQLRGKVVIIEAFQMLCPGCVLHGLPLAQSIQCSFPEDKVQVLGLHSVFEHHSAMEKHALEAFAHEYRLTFPIAIDQPVKPGPLPATMQAWGLRGTPSLLIVAPDGALFAHHFGQVSELTVGAQIGAALASSIQRASGNQPGESGCSEDGCALPLESP